MANKSAVFSISLTYTDPDGASVRAPALGITAPYAEGAQIVGGVDVPISATSGTEYSVPFGSISAATAILVENKTGQDVQVRINGQPSSVSGTLVSGTKTLALAAVTGEHLSVTVTASHGTPGDDYAVRRSSGNVIVTSYNSSGVAGSDTSDFTVYNGGSPDLFRLPNAAAVLIAMPAAAGGTPISSASVILTDTMAAAGSIATKVFGDPV